MLMMSLICPVLCGAMTAQSQPTELHVAAAADLQPVLPALAAEYERTAHVHLVISYGSSATLAQQIRNGGPFDVFLAADRSFAQQIVKAHLATESAPVPYATGVLVLWARNSSGLTPLTLNTLSDPRVTRIAVANAERAPYGRAARQALEHEHLLPKLQPKLVTAENISQAAQFVLSGNAQVGFLSLTAASSPKFTQSGSFITVPATDYASLSQCAVALRDSPHAAAGEQFLRWLTSPAVQDGLQQLGLKPAL